MVCYKCRKSILKKDRQKFGLHEKCFNVWFEVEKTVGFEEVAIKGGGSDGSDEKEFSEINSSFFHGKFKKYSAELDGREYILKVQQKEYPELPAMEYLCNQIARELHLNVPDFYFIKFYGADTFVSRNFIQKYRRQNLIHIYRFFSRREEFNCATLIDIIKRETGRLKEVERFVDLCLFDALIGNHDRHGRNIAILETNGRKILSPFYDNPSYLGIEEKGLLRAKHSPRGKIATNETEAPTLIDYVNEFQKFGCVEAVRSFCKRLKFSDILNLVNESFLSKERKQAFERLISQRYEVLKNVI